jgi:hypothetical protein
MSTQNTPVGVAPDGYTLTPNPGTVICQRCGSHVSRWLTDEHDSVWHAPQSRGGIPTPPGTATWTTGDPRVDRDLCASLAALDAIQDALSADLDAIDKLDRVEDTMREAGRKIPYDGGE